MKEVPKADIAYSFSSSLLVSKLSDSEPLVESIHVHEY